MKRFLVLLFSVGFCCSALGQSAAPKHVLEDASFVIQKERRHLLPEASRLFECAPMASLSTDVVQPLTYHLPLIAPSLEVLQRKTWILRAKQDVTTQLYGNYVQGGYGNAYTPHLEGHFANKRHPEYAYGLHIKHLSSGNNTHFEEAHNLVRLHGKYYKGPLWLGGEVGCGRDHYPLYKVRHGDAQYLTWESVELRNSVANYTQGPWDYQAGLSWSMLQRSSQFRESQLCLHGVGDYALDGMQTAQVSSDLLLMRHRRASGAVDRHLWRVQPVLNLTWQDFKAQLGVNGVCQNDKDEAIGPVNIYPLAEVTYALHEWLNPYVGVRGDVQANSLQSFVQENPRIAPHVTLRHTNQRFVVHGGVKGNAWKQVSFHTGGNIGQYQALPCWVNSRRAPGHFDIQYDAQTMLLNLFGELTYTDTAETCTTQVRGDYFYYSLKTLTQPWHRPRYQFNLVQTYRVYDKILLNGNFHWTGGLKALDVASKKGVALKDVVDLNLGIDYWWTSRFAFFLHCDNLLACRNERYLNYPGRGIHGVLGLTYTW